MIKFKALALGSLMSAALTACSAAPTTAVAGVPSLAQLVNYTVADLQAASADAKAHNDVIAQQCYDGLVPLVQGLPSQLPTVPVGVVSSFQAAWELVRAAQFGMQSPVGQAFVLACGPLILDVENAAAAEAVHHLPGPAL